MIIKLDRGIQTPPCSRITQPSVPVSDPKFKWTPGADVTETWKRLGYKPTPAAGVISRAA